MNQGLDLWAQSMAMKADREELSHRQLYCRLMLLKLGLFTWPTCFWSSVDAIALID
jgi:hypothetical protein